MSFSCSSRATARYRLAKLVLVLALGSVVEG
jgi:hypothetical protein